MLDSLWYLWFILFALIISSFGILALPFFRNSIKTRIFFFVGALCVCSVFLIVGFLADEIFTTLLYSIVGFAVFIWGLNDQLKQLKEEIVRNTQEAEQAKQRKNSNSTKEIVDAEWYEVIK